MAQKDQPEDDGEALAQAAVAKAAKKKKMLVLGGVVLALLLLAGGGSFIALKFLGNKGEPAVEAKKSDEKAAAHGEEGASANAKKTYYDALDPAFLANYMVSGRQHYLQVSLTVMTRDEESIAALHTHMPLVRNRVVMMLSGEVFEELQTDEGRVALQKKLLEAIREILTKETGKPGVEQVFFTNFVMQ